MRLVIQRVTRAEVWVENAIYCSIRAGLVVFTGIAREDSERDADPLAARLAGLRIFPGADGRMSLSAADTGAEILVVSNFTLFADIGKGKRPSFDRAARPEQAKPLYEYFVKKVQESGLSVRTGVFQAAMRVLVENDGPVTIIVDSPAHRQGRAL